MTIPPDLGDWFKEQMRSLKEQTRFSRPQVIVVTVLAIAIAFAGLLVNKQTRITKPRLEQPKRRVAVKKKEKAVTQIYVHVGGSVLRPGLYRLQLGARAAEAIQSAGGVVEDGDIDAINLATKLTDGQKIVVPKIRSLSETSSPLIYDADSEDPLVNLNTAATIQLESLDGIGPVLAGRIVDWRQKHSGFKTIRQLNDVSGIGPKKYQQIKDSVKVE